MLFFFLLQHQNLVLIIVLLTCKTLALIPLQRMHCPNKWVIVVLKYMAIGLDYTLKTEMNMKLLEMNTFEVIVYLARRVLEKIVIQPPLNPLYPMYNQSPL
jgi:hypothetical protein